MTTLATFSTAAAGAPLLREPSVIAIEIEPGSCRAEFAYEARGDDQVVIGPVTCR